MNVVIACGGTGGHLFPGLAVGELLSERGHDVLYLVSEKQIDRIALEGRRDVQVRKLPAVAWPGGFSVGLIRFFWQLWRARRFCSSLFREFVPDVVLAMGGFTSAAPIWEAQRLGVPTVIHEANAIAGRANRLLGRDATRIVVGFKETASRFDPARVVFGGTPVRSELRQKPDPVSARQELGFKADGPLVLVMGGSQGARGLNEKIIGALPHLRGTGIQWIHLSGGEDEQRVTAAYRDAGFSARVWPFYSSMHKVYASADLVISRAGASSMTEINFFGLPALYIPYPYAADDHQSANARVQVEGGAGFCLEEAGLDGERLAREIRRLIVDDRESLARLAECSRRLAVPDSAAKIADLLCELAERRKTGPILKI